MKNHSPEWRLQILIGTFFDKMYILCFDFKFSTEKTVSLIYGQIKIFFELKKVFFNSKKLLFIWYKKIFFHFKYSTRKNLRNYLFTFITLNEEKIFFKLQKIFLWITLRMSYTRLRRIHPFNSKKKKNNQEISLNQRNFSLTV